jgi:hypothetical protein
MKEWYVPNDPESKQKILKLVQSINSTIVDPLNSIVNLAIIIIFERLEINEFDFKGIKQKSIRSNFI